MAVEVNYLGHTGDFMTWNAMRFEATNTEPPHEGMLLVLLNVVACQREQTIVSQWFKVPDTHRWLHPMLYPHDDNSWTATMDAEMPDGTRVRCEAISPLAVNRPGGHYCSVTPSGSGNSIRLDTRSPELAAQWSNG